MASHLLHPPVVQVAEIEKSIDAAEANPARFRLTQAELSSRRKWAMTTRRQAERVADGVAAARGGAFAAAAGPGPSSPAAGSPAAPLPLPSPPPLLLPLPLAAAMAPLATSST